MLPCSVSFIQGSDRCLSFEGLPEEAFEHLTNLNYLYLANNKVRAHGRVGLCCPSPQCRGLSSGSFHQGFCWAGCWVPITTQTWPWEDRPRPFTGTQGIRVVR